MLPGGSAGGRIDWRVRSSLFQSVPEMGYLSVRRGLATAVQECLRENRLKFSGGNFYGPLEVALNRFRQKGGTMTDDENQQELQRKFSEQRANRAELPWPDGRLNGADEGQLVFLVSRDPDNKIIVLEFSHATKWLSLKPKEARELGQLLLQQAFKLESGREK